MKKVKIYYGSKKWFDKNCPSSYRSLTEVVNELDERNRKNVMFIANIPKNSDSDKMVEDITKKPSADILVADEGEYSGVQEHVIMNFANFIGEIDVNTLILQNPPKQIRNQLEILYPTEKNIIELEYEKYNHITLGKLKKFNQLYDEHVIGQGIVKKELLPLLYSRTISVNRNKPLVLLFCGKPGIGKTETAKYLAGIIGGKLFRQQFSMFQNNQFSNYLFGGNHHEKSFAKDLLGRESDVILLDEFDKANPIFHSAFYQLFDDGIYEDTNYYLELKDAIIICTTNYTSREEIIKNLGEAIFNRFNAIIYFEELSIDSKIQICDLAVDEICKKYKITVDPKIIERLHVKMKNLESVREIRNFIEKVFATIAFENSLSESLRK
ncbi:AAA family ATPase [Clostridium sp. AF17-2]|uniref:AAA family ATPase n=1 Tax=unclassified Clostridium TaxID=2614128 RepID=UPI000E548B90|nr:MULTISPECIES: AAA family ATPase [unclassified Clostridium]RGG77366.1 AAA family ATPase [Clostridium sp. AF17-21AC]RHR58141.1 AAA family ATPase [Clostridium sp. AF17-2]